MVRTLSTLFQTMMRCYSSLRAEKGHLFSFPIPVQQVIPTYKHDPKVATEHFTQRGLGNEKKNEQNFRQNGMVIAGITRAKLEVE